MTHDSDDDDCDELPEGEVQRRAAFDIGSGATKLMIADVDVESGTIGTVVHSAERTVKYALDWKKHGTLSEDVQADYRDLVAQGVEFLGPPTACTKRMADVAICRDPDGTLIELIQVHLDRWPRAPKD